MTTPWQRALDSLFDSDVGIDAVFQPRFGQWAAVRLVYKNPDDFMDIEGLPLRVEKGAAVYELRKSQVPIVRRGDILQLNVTAPDPAAEAVEITGTIKQLDSFRLVHTMTTQPKEIET